MASDRQDSEQIAIVAITKEAIELALRLADILKNATVYIFQKNYNALKGYSAAVRPFDNISSVFPEIWNRHNVIICIMATGIVVRTVASLIRNKKSDPAVLVIDEQGRFVISLLSGHYGGANAWAQRMAELLGATPVITTSSDVKGKIALDLLARDNGLVIVEHPDDPSISLAATMRRLLDDEPMWIFDPESRIVSQLTKDYPSLTSVPESSLLRKVNTYGIWVSERLPPEDLRCLRFHPKNLIVGIGCNRGTSADEIVSLIKKVLQQEGLFIGSIQALVSVEIKQDEAGLKEASERLGVPLFFVSIKSLDTVSVLNPSEIVKKHIGVKGVCEAAPIALNPSAQLIVPKTKSANATAAIARVPFQLSA
ncbi:MAG: cobalamin biosynthesis protein [Thermodesulforhabdaceae bacterium]